MRRTSQIVVNSQFVRAQVECQLQDSQNITTIYNIAPVVSTSDTVGGHLPKREEGAVPILYVGQLSEHKGLIPLVQAYAKIRSDYPGTVLWIVGKSMYDDEFHERIIHLAQQLGVINHIVFAGQTNPTPWYQQAVIHVLPSLFSDPAPNVVLEAKREGLPSIVFPSGGAPELIRHKIDGFICRERSVTALEEGLRYLLSDLSGLRAMRAAAKENSTLTFGKDRFYRLWSEVYLSTSPR